MTIVEITRGMLRAARSLTGLSQQARRPRFNFASLPKNQGGIERQRSQRRVRALYRVVSALETEGVIFTSDGVRLQRLASMGTALHSERAAA